MSGGEFFETGESVWCINCGHHFDDHILAPLPPQLESPYIFHEARQYLGCKGKAEEGGCNCIKFIPHEIDREKTKKIRSLLEDILNRPLGSIIYKASNLGNHVYLFMCFCIL
jgi:hypothetical protein